VAFPNPERIVRPGQYVRVRVVLDVKQDAILVPQAAVQELQATYSVAVVGSDNKTEFRPVEMGRRVGSLWVVEQGLRPGERVVVQGLQKVRHGITVTPTTVTIGDEAATPPEPGE
jgi:membrane fusion protein (multidrug efflux system)